MPTHIVCRGAFLVGTALAILVLSASPVAAEIGLPGGSVYVRKEFHTLTESEIDAYRRGVELMQSRPYTNPTSWWYQANIHGVPAGSGCGTETPGSYPAWSSCQHGTFFFLPWHRMYLYFFERILRSAVREAMGDPRYPFALPYWDYELHPVLPAPFRELAPLRAPRSQRCNQGLPCIPPPSGSSEVALALLHFCNCPPETSCAACQRNLDPSFTFGSEYSAIPRYTWSGSGQLEQQPHNIVHSLIGGWMAQVPCAARDPIFFLHHANIDRLWQVWLNLGLGRANPLGAENWRNERFTFFNEARQAVVLTGCEILDMADQLGYVYFGVPVLNVQRCEDPIWTPVDVTPEKETLAASAPAELDLGAAPASVEVSLSDESSRRILDTAASGSGRILLIVDGVSLVNPGAAYYVYVNLPPWEQPDPYGSHFAGTLAVFGDPDHPHEQSFGYDITEKVRSLSERGLWANPLRVTWVRIDSEEESDPDVFLRIGQVSVAKQ